MRQMKDSGIEWIGEIPQAWDVRKGKYLFAQRNERGNNVKLQLLSPTQNYGVIPQDEYERLSGMSAVKLNENINLKALKTIHKGDYCISLRSFQGGFEYSMNEGVISPAYQVFYPTVKISGGYYKYLFKDKGFISVINSYAMSLRDGKNISFEQFGNTVIPVPPLAEQERIAGFLDAKCAEVDALAGEIKEQIATLEEYKRSVITEAVTKGLDASVPMKNSGIEWIGEIPQVWDANRLRNLIVRREGGVWGLEPDDYEQGTICLRVADFNFGKGRFVEDNIDAFTKRKYSYAQILKYKLKKGDILIEKSGGGEKTPVGRAVLFDKAFTALFANFMDRLRFNNEIVNPYFIEYWLRAWYYCGASPYYINQTIGIQNINLSLMLAKQIIFYPPLAEQERIVEFLDAKCAKVDALIAEKQNQLATLEEYKKSVIFEYVTGKKEVV